MKKIEEAKDDCILDCGCLSYRESDYTAGYAGGIDYGFEAGVEFAQRWISVEDELPKTIDDEKIFLREPILIRNIDGALQVLNTFSNIGTYTHWRPIELK